MKRLFALLCLTSLLPVSIQADSSTAKEPLLWPIIYIPVKNTKLKQYKVKSDLYEDRMPTNDHYYAAVASWALPILFRKAASSFPMGTKLTKVPQSKDGVMQVSLSKEFLQRGFWRNKQRTLLAVYAIVNTAGEDVRFLVDGKPIRNLANIDMRKPLSPRMDLVVGHKNI